MSGTVKYVGEILFPTRTIYVYWELGEDDENGLEIQLSVECKETEELEGIMNWQFGNGLAAYQLWMNWGETLERAIQECIDETMLTNLLTKVEHIEVSQILKGIEL